MRPVREQLEHDRVIRLLQAKYKRKFEVAINPGQRADGACRVRPQSPWYPGPGVAGVGEVLASWWALSRSRRPSRSITSRRCRSGRRSPALKVQFHLVRARVGCGQCAAALRRPSDHDHRNLGVSRHWRSDPFHAGAASRRKPGMAVPDPSVSRASRRPAVKPAGRKTRCPPARAVSRATTRACRCETSRADAAARPKPRSRACSNQEHGDLASRRGKSHRSEVRVSVARLLKRK